MGQATTICCNLDVQNDGSFVLHSLAILPHSYKPGSYVRLKSEKQMTSKRDVIDLAPNRLAQY